MNNLGVQKDQLKELIVEALEEADNEKKQKTTFVAQFIRSGLIENFDDDEDTTQWFVVAGYGLGFDVRMVGSAEFFVDLNFFASGLRIVMWKREG